MMNNNEATENKTKPRSSGSLFKRLVMWLRQKYCDHEFVLKDLTSTKILPPDKPTSNNYDEWSKYYNSLSGHDSHRKRVYWPCNKCGKTFYAHCGLDISPEHGLIVKG